MGYAHVTFHLPLVPPTAAWASALSYAIQDRFSTREVSGIIEPIAKIQDDLKQCGYIAGRPLATALHLALTLEKPLLVEGPAGVGKTSVAKVLAGLLGTRLVRLQCYEGLDAAAALYEWNYPKQMLHIRMTENSGQSLSQREAEIFSRPFLLRRPLLDAISDDKKAPVLLIDEIDRADEAFEAFLLEVLAEFQVTIPELGTVHARYKPHVILTSNRTRELSDALRRRCLYHWLPYPDMTAETEIIQAHLPQIEEKLAAQVVKLVSRLRSKPLNKTPGVAESLDWARALLALACHRLDEKVLKDTFSCLLKDKEDLELIERQGVSALLAEVLD